MQTYQIFQEWLGRLGAGSEAVEESVCVRGGKEEPGRARSTDFVAGAQSMGQAQQLRFRGRGQRNRLLEGRWATAKLQGLSDAASAAQAPSAEGCGQSCKCRVRAVPLND